MSYDDFSNDLYEQWYSNEIKSWGNHQYQRMIILMLIENNSLLQDLKDLLLNQEHNDDVSASGGSGTNVT